MRAPPRVVSAPRPASFSDPESDALVEWNAGHEPEQQSRRNRQRQSEGRDGRVDADLGQARYPLRLETDERVHTPYGEQQSERASGGSENRALGQKLAHQSTASCPERAADGHLRFARRRAGEQEIRDVRARDEQHESHGAEQDEHRLPDVPDHGFVKRYRREVQPLVHVGILLRELLANRLDLGGGLLDGNPGLDSSHRGQIPRAALARRELLRVFERRPDHTPRRIREILPA